MDQSLPLILQAIGESKAKQSQFLACNKLIPQFFSGVVLNDVKHIREALGMQEFAGRPKLRPFLERSNDGRLRGIIMGSGPVHTQLRRFAFRNLRDFGFGRASMESMIMDEAHELMNALSSYEGSPFQTKYLFNMAAVNSLWWIINGERFTYEDEQLKLIVRQLTE